MSTVWLLYGYCMSNVWVLYGHCMGTILVPLGHFIMGADNTNVCPSEMPASDSQMVIDVVK